MVPLSQMKTALVLSGGGMFGAYQAGVWKTLSHDFAPDIVIGASVGALNGWCIASGVSASDLERQWLDPDTAGLMKYRFVPLPWSVFDPRAIETQAKLLLENYRPRVDFGVVVLQLPRLRPKLVRAGEVTWRHLVATCAVPGGFPPVRIGDGLYCDGGLLDPTPIWAAAAMGATRIIAVNASRFLSPRPLRMIMRGVCLWSKGHGPPKRDGGIELLMITPQDYLGKMSEGASWQRDKIRRWIDLGEADAAAALKASK